MPSPLGHALGGFVAGWLVAGGSQSWDPPSGGFLGRSWDPPSGGLRLSRESRLALAFALTGMAADLDLLIGRHSQFTHSLGMSLIVLAAALLLLRGRRNPVVLAGAFAAAYASHPLLDWLGQDATAPFGIMALWPFSGRYYLSHADIFWGISRQPWRQGAIGHDLLAVGLEVLILLPLAALAWRWRRARTTWQILPNGSERRRQRLPRGRLGGPEGESGASH